MTYFKNKVIWITGASSGIGRALAQHLSEFECKLILSARRENVLNEVKSQCKKPEMVTILPFDLANIDQMKNIVKIGISQFGRIDLLINNGGISQRSALIETSIEVDKKLMDIDYLGTVALSKAILPHFIANGGGQFAVVTSLMGRFSSPYRSAYCGAKHALHGFFNSLRLEHEKDNVKVTLICPGFVNTDIARNALVGDGTAQGYQDQKTEKGMAVGEFAKKMLNAIRKGKFEAYIGGFERIGVLVSRISPRLIHFMVKNMSVR
ncbi:MAG: SDR family oxidoreductase [Bacteroidota bacterium]